MAQVTLTVGGRDYPVACRDGEEAHLLRLAGILDARVREVGATMGGVNEARQLLLAGLLLADEASGGGEAPRAATELVPALDLLAARIEKLADRLEAGPIAP